MAQLEGLEAEGQPEAEPETEQEPVPELEEDQPRKLKVVRTVAVGELIVVTHTKTIGDQTSLRSAYGWTPLATSIGGVETVLFQKLFSVLTEQKHDREKLKQYYDNEEGQLPLDTPLKYIAMANVGVTLRSYVSDSQLEETTKSSKPEIVATVAEGDTIIVTHVKTVGDQTSLRSKHGWTPLIQIRHEKTGITRLDGSLAVNSIETIFFEKQFHDHELHELYPNLSRDYKKHLALFMERKNIDVVALTLQLLEECLQECHDSLQGLSHSQILKSMTDTCAKLWSECETGKFTHFKSQIKKFNSSIIESEDHLSAEIQVQLDKRSLVRVRTEDPEMETRQLKSQIADMRVSTEGTKAKAKRSAAEAAKLDRSRSYEKKLKRLKNEYNKLLQTVDKALKSHRTRDNIATITTSKTFESVADRLCHGAITFASISDAAEAAQAAERAKQELDNAKKTQLDKQEEVEDADGGEDSPIKWGMLANASKAVNQAVGYVTSSKKDKSTKIQLGKHGKQITLSAAKEKQQKETQAQQTIQEAKDSQRAKELRALDDASKQATAASKAALAKESENKALLDAEVADCESICTILKRVRDGIMEQIVPAQGGRRISVVDGALVREIEVEVGKRTHHKDQEWTTNDLVDTVDFDTCVATISKFYSSYQGLGTATRRYITKCIARIAPKGYAEFEVRRYLNDFYSLELWQIDNLMLWLCTYVPAVYAAGGRVRAKDYTTFAENLDDAVMGWWEYKNSVAGGACNRKTHPVDKAQVKGQAAVALRRIAGQPIDETAPDALTIQVQVLDVLRTIVAQHFGLEVSELKSHLSSLTSDWSISSLAEGDGFFSGKLKVPVDKSSKSERKTYIELQIKEVVLQLAKEFPKMDIQAGKMQVPDQFMIQRFKEVKSIPLTDLAALIHGKYSVEFGSMQFEYELGDVTNVNIKRLLVHVSKILKQQKQQKESETLEQLQRYAEQCYNLSAKGLVAVLLVASVSKVDLITSTDVGPDKFVDKAIKMYANYAGKTLPKNTYKGGRVVIDIRPQDNVGDALRTVLAMHFKVLPGRIKGDTTLRELISNKIGTNQQAEDELMHMNSLVARLVFTAGAMRNDSGLLARLDLLEFVLRVPTYGSITSAESRSSAHFQKELKTLAAAPTQTSDPQQAVEVSSIVDESYVGFAIRLNNAGLLNSLCSTGGGMALTLADLHTAAAMIKANLTDRASVVSDIFLSVCRNFSNPASAVMAAMNVPIPTLDITSADQWVRSERTHMRWIVLGYFDTEDATTDENEFTELASHFATSESFPPSPFALSSKQTIVQLATRLAPGTITPESAIASCCLVIDKSSGRASAQLLTGENLIFALKQLAQRESRAQRAAVRRRLAGGFETVWTPYVERLMAAGLFEPFYAWLNEMKQEYALPFDVEAVRGFRGKTLSHFAAAANLAGSPYGRALFSNTASFASDISGQTVLHVAAKCGDIDCMRQVLKCSNNPYELSDLRTVNGLSPLHLAAKFTNVDCLRLLLSLRDPNLSQRKNLNSTYVDGVAKNGRTALQLAVWRLHDQTTDADWVGTINILLLAGADPLRINTFSSRESALSIALACSGVSKSRLADCLDDALKSEDDIVRTSDWNIHGLVRDCAQVADSRMEKSKPFHRLKLMLDLGAYNFHIDTVHHTIQILQQ